MSFIVQIAYTAPSMNTRSKKRGIVIDPANQLHFSKGLINSQRYFFTLPNTLDDNLFVHLVQADTLLYDLQDLDHVDIKNHKEGKRRLAELRAMKREKKRMEKVV